MACIPVPQVPMPSLPGGITLAPPAPPSIEFEPQLCCKLLPFQVQPPPIPLPPGVINAGTAAIIAATLQSVQTYLDALPVECPRE